MAWTVALRDKFGWGETRLARLFSEAAKHMAMLQSGEVDVNELLAALVAEMPGWARFLADEGIAV